MVTDQLTPDEMAELQKFLSVDSPQTDTKHNVHSFLREVATSKDTTKTGYLLDPELGIPKLPVRTDKELATFSEDVITRKVFADYFRSMSEITTSTSLSRDAKLLELAVINRRQLEDVTKRPRAKGGWFKKKEKEEGGVTNE